jgi:hypothetical protein
MLRRAAFVLGFCLVTLAGAERARADVVGPEPLFCWPGTVGVSDHSGSRCEDKAPTNCPSGWEGRIGGECSVESCSTTSQSCEEGETCVAAEICVEARRAFGRWTDAGGEPYDAELGICGPGAACDPPRRCVPKSVCVRNGEAPTTYVPPAGRDEPTGLPRRGACGSCAAGDERGAAAATFAVGAAW